MSCVNAVRIVNADFYMTSPIQGLDVMYSDFRGSSVTQVPVIRIFGSADTGKKICLHIHGVFPYLYIPYDGSEDANSLKYQIAASIDKALNISFGQGSSTTQHVYKVSLVSGIPLYGYHVREHQFFKIFLFNPALIRKVSNMLQSEVILGKLYQPHESHIPFVLQFMIDYNLHGMSKILLSEMKYRGSPGEGASNSENLFSPSIPKQSSCELEADALSEHILNRLEVSKGNIAINPGIAALWEDEKQRLRDKNENSQISPCLTLSSVQVAPTKSHLIFKQALLEKLTLSENAVEKVEQNLTVYPAETPPNKTVKNASLIDFHTPLSSDVANDTLDSTSTFDDEAKNLFEVLHDLGENAEIGDADSILSQVQNENENDDDDDDYLDLSVSMAETTPFKNIMNEMDVDDDILNTTVVPQLDGHHDSDSSDECDRNTDKKPNQKGKSSSKYVALPIYVSSSAISNEKQDITVYEDSLECELKPERREKICNLQSSLDQEKISEEKKKEVGFTVAQLYDFQTNFKAKEGSSKKLTQNSETCDLSNPSIDPKTSQTSDDSWYYNGEFSQKLHQEDRLSTNLPQISEHPPLRNVIITPQYKPPTRSEVIESLDKLNIPKTAHEIPYYGNVEDVTGSVEIGHSVLKILSKTTAHLEDFKSCFNGLDAHRKTMLPDNVKWSHENVKNLKLSFCSVGSCVITPAKQPPTVEAVMEWIKNKSAIPQEADVKKDREKVTVHIPTSPGRLDESDLELSLSISTCDSDSAVSSPVLEKKRKIVSQRANSCQITGVTLNNTYGFKITPENFQNARACNECQYITIMSVELHVQTRGDLKPDPAYDSIEAVFYSITEDSPESINKSGIIAVGADSVKSENCDCVASEEELINEFVKLIQKWDPDLFVGYEIEMLSWGYLLDRARVLGNNLIFTLSRIIDGKNSRNYDDDGSLKITGRIVLDVWRLLRHEIALQSYTFENIVYHILHQRIPLYSFKDLSSWWNSSLHRHRTISYYSFRAEGSLKIMEQLDLIGRTSELARLFGIQFFEVLSRGSQFRVESMMLRLAKPLNYIPVSPSVQQRAKMKAPEFLPLILEPESRLYVDPVIVLDFQSLYPSMIIAYNYCFSTCLGKVIHLGKNSPFEFGATQLKVSRDRVRKLVNGDCLNFSPCGVAYVKSHIRDGILPRMLREILETRLMVKNSMKKNKDDKLLLKVLHNRQLGLKLIANVTYGYTAANFSGRMPAMELADSVVSKGRETLQRAIAMVESTPEWKAKVVYGDTDSLFVLVPGKSRTEAFEIGRKIAEAVTNDNPDPVKLKLEKVYHPCILQTKKRYVGYMYESPEQSEPTYDAKGIETVRRDGCPAVAKMLEKCLRLLFETKNVSLVKQYVQRQFQKILIGRISLQDLTFAKEYRGASGYRPGACVPALELTRKWTAIDKRNEPRNKQRVPYVIASGPPGVPLIRLVRSPTEFLDDPSLRPNAIYYITKVIIPPINRCFNLIGADLTGWFNQMPRKHLQYLPNFSPGKKNTISQYFSSNICAVCGEQTQNSLCNECVNQQQNTSVILHEKIRLWEKSYCNVNLICQTCTGITDQNVCVSLDCPVLYRVNQTTRDLQQTTYVRQVLSSLTCEYET
ncbi:DNA polymerase zeta catalytic subunit [Asbolus verrucosus]|uniref:DNA polymerase n=1 Tax=Asbolus verrucosus TaxID=1661398 RepID=A0A482VEA6_ASBVE|nr:DNA polymerase zeta catalytic subunit [Asbolus verrucosus]